jgi:DNA (cytosine-5)-methyltransferase 1
LAHGFYKADEVSSGLKARDYNGDTDIVLAVDARNCTEDEVNGSLQSNSAHSLNGNNVVMVKYIVRRLTPLECERLQGFPDGHTDIGEYIDTKGKKCKTSDASRYKALGNSIALPSWKWILKRLCATYERDATMASLFDGIGGFPLLWEQINGKGSCLWASEIEEFPIAVTKARIGE